MEIQTLLVSGNVSGTVGYYNALSYSLIVPKIGPSADYYGFWSVRYLDDIVYVSDGSHNKIWKFDFTTRALISSFSTVPFSGVDAPMDIYNDVIYLLQISSGNVYKYDTSGNLLGSFNGGPAWVTFDMTVVNGYVYVYWAETYANEGRITKYSLEGVFQGTVNFDGAAGGFFIDTEMIIANTYFSKLKLQVYSLGGSLLRESPTETWFSAMHTVLATTSLIYICNSHYSNVSVYNRSTLVKLSTFANETAAVGICFGKSFFGYPPADPIDDNPNTLPDPGGDPQTLTFRTETYKAIRSGRELRGK